MPRRTFKSLFVELVSFLTLFALIGTMTSNFWERYLIQSELSNMKSSLHLLKETVHNIGAAYDNLHYELSGLAGMKEIKSTKSSIPKQISRAQKRNTPDINAFSTMVMHEIMNPKADKGIGITVSKGTSNSDGSCKKVLKFILKNATTTTRNPLKSTGINFDAEALEKHSARDDYRNNLESGHVHKCCKKDCSESQSNKRC